MLYIYKLIVLAIHLLFSHTSFQSHSFTLNATKLYRFLWLYNIAFWTLLDMLSFFWVLVLFSHGFWKQQQFPSPCMNMLAFNTNQTILGMDKTGESNLYFSKDSYPYPLYCYQYIRFWKVFSHSFIFPEIAFWETLSERCGMQTNWIKYERQMIWALF